MAERRTVKRLLAAGATAAPVLLAGAAAGAPPVFAAVDTTPGSATLVVPASASATVEVTEPDPSPLRRRARLQYGVAFTVEGVASAGPICSHPADPCILGSGAGIAVRTGWRPTERLYFGGAYELSKQDPSKLYRLAILQQARAEARYYFLNGHRVTPYAVAGVGVGGYGNEWSIDTWGPAGVFGVGVEADLSGGALFGLALLYRPLDFHAFVDSSTLSHDAGVSHLIGLELVLEARDAP